MVWFKKVAVLESNTKTISQHASALTSVLQHFGIAGVHELADDAAETGHREKRFQSGGIRRADGESWGVVAGALEGWRNFREDIALLTSALFGASNQHG
ncbi:MAG TPA: hypothetical protein VK335_02975 [Bryobacteraceae bacterium]|nr:hypothetical protein [Bryobacteraceae bacterium]